MVNNIELIAQSALRIKYNDKIIYFDPFKINNKYLKDADYIFITHPHYDHFNEEDLKTIMKDSTKIIVPNELEDNCKSLGFNNIICVSPNNEYSVDDIIFKTINAYNIDKPFHKKESNWVGYIINLNNESIYVSGDTDIIDEIKNIKCDIACICIGGHYTCNYMEAVDFIKTIKPKHAIPTHYKTVVGSLDDAINFKKELDSICDVKILME
jgi:L-ascorbate metabolism protein UlaG (beta-lactamase superfamily)